MGIEPGCQATLREKDTKKKVMGIQWRRGKDVDKKEQKNKYNQNQNQEKGKGKEEKERRLCDGGIDRVRRKRPLGLSFSGAASRRVP